MTTKKKHGPLLEKALQDGDFKASVSRIALTPADVLRILRSKAELTQKELAELSGIDQSTISSLERGRIDLGVARAKALATALKVHPATLLFPNWEIGKGAAA